MFIEKNIVEQKCMVKMQKTSWEVVYVLPSVGTSVTNHLFTIPQMELDEITYSRFLDSPRSNLNLGRTCAISGDVFRHHFHKTDFFLCRIWSKYHKGIPFIFISSRPSLFLNVWIWKKKKKKNLHWEAGELERTRNPFLHHGYFSFY